MCSEKDPPIFHVPSSHPHTLSSPDPVRLLTSLGADLFAIDHTHCTAVHHAAENHNYLAVKHLVTVGAPLNLKNKEVPNALSKTLNQLAAWQGKTAYDVAMEAQNKFAMDTIAMGRSKREPQGLWELVTRQPVSPESCVCVCVCANV